MNNILAVFAKQIKDTFRNKTILIQFLMFPVITLVMENAVRIDGMPEHFFANLFSVMFITMAPLTCVSAIISEENEKGTLRVLLMSDVSALQYLAGVGSYVFILCMAGSAVIGLAGGYSGGKFVRFMLLMAAGTVISLLIGAAVGTLSRSQMTATGVVVPLMCVLSFLPMLAMFNETIAKISGYVYSGGISELISSGEPAGAKGMTVLCVNAALALAAFITAYRKSARA